MTAIRRRMGPLAFLILAAGAAASAAAQQPAVADARVKAQIEQRLFDAGLVTVKVAVEDGHVTLAGRVEDLKSKDAAVKEARKVKGVKDVTTTLTVRLPESDTDLASSVSGALIGSTFLTMFDEVGGTVEGGVATLTGFVTSPDKARRAADAVAEVPGVQKVVNQIEVLPASPFDDQIRLELANQIYSSLAASTLANPNARPVHIIVNGGHVRLVGSVTSEMDRKLAGIIARQVSGVHDVDNALTVG